MERSLHDGPDRSLDRHDAHRRDGRPPSRESAIARRGRHGHRPTMGVEPVREQRIRAQDREWRDRGSGQQGERPANAAAHHRVRGVERRRRYRGSDGGHRSNGSQGSDGGHGCDRCDRINRNDRNDGRDRSDRCAGSHWAPRSRHPRPDRHDGSHGHNGSDGTHRCHGHDRYAGTERCDWCGRGDGRAGTDGAAGSQWCDGADRTDGAAGYPGASRESPG
jgi:hypothetical protein